MFDDDLWDFTDVAGLPVSMGPNIRRLSFTQITDPRWRLVAKELIFAMLVPRHEAVAPLPRAYRVPVHVATASRRLGETVRFLNWLAGQGVDSLSEIGTHHCEAYLAYRRHVTSEDGTVVGELSPGSRRSAAQAIIDMRQLPGSCSPPTGPTPACGHGAGPPPPRSRRCPAAGTRTRRSRSATASCSPCSPRPSTLPPSSAPTPSS